MRFIIGLTGGIGSGKSTAAARFATHGIEVIDTDALAHALTAPHGAAIAAIEQMFGSAMITTEGALDRTKMRDCVFQNPEKKRQLEAILHPMIRAQSDQHCAEATTPYVILAVPLLVESGEYIQRVNRICVIDCTVETQIARTMARSNISRERVQNIIHSQASRAQRLAVADDIVNNDGPQAALAQQIDTLHRHYLTLV